MRVKEEEKSRSHERKNPIYRWVKEMRDQKRSRKKHKS
jgi:hypothetical protein